MNTLSVPKNSLMLIAGLVWCAAGASVSRIGIPLLWRFGGARLDLDALAVLVFLVFYLFVFSRLVGRHAARLCQDPASHLPVWAFFDGRSYVVMAVMMFGGMWLRLSHAVPLWMIAFFYSGLGVALFSSGTRFLWAYARGDVTSGAGRAGGA
ncbi:MAG: hypothetical protein ACYC7F_03840 [Gemmatimonadaceae bacterium]